MYEQIEERLPALLLSIHEDQLIDMNEELDSECWGLWSQFGGGGGS